MNDRRQALETDLAALLAVKSGASESIGFGLRGRWIFLIAVVLSFIVWTTGMGIWNSTVVQAIPGLRAVSPRPAPPSQATDPAAGTATAPPAGQSAAPAPPVTPAAPAPSRDMTRAATLSDPTRDQDGAGAKRGDRATDHKKQKRAAHKRAAKKTVLPASRDRDTSNADELDRKRKAREFRLDTIDAIRDLRLK